MKRNLLSAMLTAFLAIGTNAQIVPFFEAKNGGLFGGSRAGDFVNAETVFDGLKDDFQYTLYGPTGKKGKMTARIEAPSEPCEDFYYAKTPLERQTGVAIGDNVSWNPTPRVAKAISLRDPTYLKIVTGILRKKGLKTAKARLEQAVRVDLDGDGRDEVILTASSFGGTITPHANKNDYSLILLRKVVGKTVKTIILAEEIVKNNIDFGAPSRYEISSLLDLNGDGKMEIVMYGEYYEGSGVSVYEIKEDSAPEIKMLETGCGV